MPYDSIINEMQEKYESIESLANFLEAKFQEHGKDWTEVSGDFSTFSFEQAAEQLRNHVRTKYWYEPLSCNYLILLVYSILEDSLNRICKEIELHSGLNITLNDFAGKGIERATNYITKVAGIANIRDHKNWQHIKSYAVVRNAIAHSNGRIEDIKDREKVPKTIKLDKTSGEITLNFGDIREFYKISKSYLEYVFEQLEKRVMTS